MALAWATKSDVVDGMVDEVAGTAGTVGAELALVGHALVTSVLVWGVDAGDEATLGVEVQLLSSSVAVKAIVTMPTRWRCQRRVSIVHPLSRF